MGAGAAFAVFVVVGVAAIIGFVATRPDSFRVQRSALIQAPPERIFAILSDFHRWPEWSPWEKIDPALRRAFSGAPSGKGAVYEWEGNNKVGKGRMEIVEARALSLLKIDLHFMKPFEARNIAEYTLAPRDGGILVTWAMYGPANFISKLMGLFMSMDKMVGKSFEEGLANLKSLAEKAP
jgi:uncharacterized protein YndB with AHSA1/START domain